MIVGTVFSFNDLKVIGVFLGLVFGFLCGVLAAALVGLTFTYEPKVLRLFYGLVVGGLVFVVFLTVYERVVFGGSKKKVDVSRSSLSEVLEDYGLKKIYVPLFYQKFRFWLMWCFWFGEDDA